MKTRKKSLLSTVMFLLTSMLLCSNRSVKAQETSSVETDVKNVMQQVEGWEWLYIEEPTICTEHYPNEITYAKYKSHPEYRVLYYSTEHISVYDNNGKLLREVLPPFFVIDVGEGIIIDHKAKWRENCVGHYFRWDNTPEIKDAIRKALMVHDYKNNMYGIQKEPENVKKGIEKRLGIAPDNSDLSEYEKREICKLLNIPYQQGMIVSQMRTELEKKFPHYSTIDLLQMFIQATGAVLSRNSTPPASVNKYIEQLNSDYDSDLKNHPLIERIDDLNFKLTYDIKSRGVKAVAIVRYYSDKPYTNHYNINVTLIK